MPRSTAASSPIREKILFDIGHPAHVHLFRNFISYLEKNDISYVVTSRRKDLTTLLLDYYEIEHEVISKQTFSWVGQLIEFFLRTVRIYFLHRKHRFTLAAGTSVSIGYLTLLTAGRVKSFNFCEDDDDVIPLQALLSYPFSTWIVNPESIRHTRWAAKRVLLPTLHELAYLHPDHFTPDPEVLTKYGLKRGDFLIMRLSSLKAHHDRNEEGISSDLVSNLRETAGPLVIIESRELADGQNIDPWDMHHLLAFCRLLVSDSQTMTIEAALLGTPTIRISSFKNRLSCLEEIEHELDYARSFLPNQTDAILQAVVESVRGDTSKADTAKARDRFLESKLDLTHWMIGGMLKDDPSGHVEEWRNANAEDGNY